MATGWGGSRVCREGDRVGLDRPPILRGRDSLPNQPTPSFLRRQESTRAAPTHHTPHHPPTHTVIPAKAGIHTNQPPPTTISTTPNQHHHPPQARREPRNTPLSLRERARVRVKNPSTTNTNYSPVVRLCTEACMTTELPEPFRNTVYLYKVSGCNPPFNQPISFPPLAPPLLLHDGTNLAPS